MDNKHQEVEENESNYTSSKYVTPDGVPSDVVIFTITSEDKNPGTQLPIRDIQVLMVKRKNWPYKGSWALPGGFSNPNEHPMEAAKRELEEETKVTGLKIEHLGPYAGLLENGQPRDPRGWIISLAYYALVNENKLKNRKAGDDAAKTELVSLNDIFSMKRGNSNGTEEENEGTLAFDHADIIDDAFEEIQGKMLNTDIAKEFLDEEFTLSELYQIVETIVPGFDEPKPNFRRKLLLRGIIEEIEGKESSKYSRNPAQLFRFTGKLPQLSIYS